MHVFVFVLCGDGGGERGRVFADNWRDRNSCSWKEAIDSVLNVLTHVLYTHHTRCLSVCIEHSSHPASMSHRLILQRPLPLNLVGERMKRAAGQSTSLPRHLQQCLSVLTNNECDRRIYT